MDSEVLARPRAILLFKDSIRTWDSPGDAEPLNDADRDRIVGNVHRAFESCGYQLEVHGDFDRR
jgi:hypothetical protein